MIPTLHNTTVVGWYEPFLPKKKPAVFLSSVVRGYHGVAILTPSGRLGETFPPLPFTVCIPLCPLSSHITISSSRGKDRVTGLP